MPAGHTYLLSWVPSRAPTGVPVTGVGSWLWGQLHGLRHWPCSPTGGQAGSAPGGAGAAAATTAPGDAGEVPPHLQYCADRWLTQAWESGKGARAPS